MLDPENSDTVRLYWDEFTNKHNLGVADTIFADGFVLHDPLSPTPVSGHQTFVEMLTHYFRAFPDATFTREEDFAEPSKVATRYTMRATHQGPFMGIAATGKKVTYSGVAMLYLKAGKITALRIEANLIGLDQQLGAVPNLDLSC